MTLKRQLLLVSLLALILPWAGCEFIRETEGALRASQQQLLAGAARAIADSLAQYGEEFPLHESTDFDAGSQLYGHPLSGAPSIDGYFADWPIGDEALARLRGSDGPIEFAVGVHEQFVFLFVAVSDRDVVYADPRALARGETVPAADRVQLVSANPPYLEQRLLFMADAPGPIIAWLDGDTGIAAEPTVRAHWQDVPGGYLVEARIPRRLLGTHLGLIVENAAGGTRSTVRSASFDTATPGAFVTLSPELTRIGRGLVQSGMRLTITDSAGWRIATVGSLAGETPQPNGLGTRLLRFFYDALVEAGDAPAQAAPSPRGRELVAYVQSALDGRSGSAWFRAEDSGRAIVAVAEPVQVGTQTVGAVILQQSTDAILSLTNEGLARLMSVTLIAMLAVAAILLGYASWLSRRIRRLSRAALTALDSDQLRVALPSGRAKDELGDLSRSFSSVLTQLGDYNDYLQSLASKLSHELRTPLAIVTSSLDNLEHEQLTGGARDYTQRARDGAERLQRILTAMSEASRVEELIRGAEPERFELLPVLEAAVAAYRDVYTERRIELSADEAESGMHGSPELLIQMLDKLVDNAVSFSADGDAIRLRLRRDGGALRVDVDNPGPPLPERMQSQLFDSMVSVRPSGDNRHLGLGLHIARIIAEGHGGRMDAENIDGGVRFSVWLPASERPGNG